MALSWFLLFHATNSLFPEHRKPSENLILFWISVGQGGRSLQKKSSGTLMKQQSWSCLCLIWLCSRATSLPRLCVISRNSIVGYFSVFPQKYLPWKLHLKESSSPPYYSTLLCFLRGALPKPDIVYLPFVCQQFLLTGRCYSAHILGFILSQ